MVKIVGIVRTSFQPKDSATTIEGLTIHTTEPIARDRGEGVVTDHFFLTMDKLKSLQFTPAVGQEIEVLYTKWGKVGTLNLCNPANTETEID